MAKEYPEEEPQMVSEPAVAVHYNAQIQHINIKHIDDVDFTDAAAPCQYSLDEVKSILISNIEDFHKGRYHTMEDVNRIMDNWC